jgi:type II secretory pathway pseudopilin PulG
VRTDSRQSGNNRCCRHAFSLIEVVLALSVGTFAILVIIGLLPSGIRSTRDSLEETAANDILSEVIADRQASPINQSSATYKLPALTSVSQIPVTNYFGITEENQMSNQLSQSRYRVDYVLIPPLSGHFGPYQAWFRISWPAPSASPSGFVETVMTFPQP